MGRGSRGRRSWTISKMYLQERIEAARPRWIPAVVLWREIRERGYRGGVTQLKAFIKPFKQRKDDPVVRFETAPGEQMQADFTVIRRGRDPLLAFVATLGYSRATWVRFTTSECRHEPPTRAYCGAVREAQARAHRHRMDTARPGSGA